MLPKMTSKNHLTLPKSLTAAVDSLDQRGDAVRAKLAELRLQEQDFVEAVQWVRQATELPCKK